MTSSLPSNKHLINTSTATFLVMLRPRSSKPACYILFQSLSTNSPTSGIVNSINNPFEKVIQLCSRGDVQEAISLFYNLHPPQSPPPPQQPPPLSHHHHQTYATLFNACARHGLTEHGVSVHHHQTYATLFNACARDGFVEHGISLHHHMLAHHTNKNDPPTLFATNHLVNMYAKFGYLDTARTLFDEMPDKNLVSWTVLVSGYAQHGRADECFSLFSDMLLHFRPTEFAFASVLSSCGEGELDRGRQVHALVLKICYDAYVYAANALISMYCKSCGGGNGSVYECGKDEAWRVFEEMEFRNLISWNSMIAGFQHRRLGIRTINLFAQMHRDGIGFDRSTLLSLLSSISATNEKLVELALKYCYQLHSLCIKTGFIMASIEVATALVKSYSNLGGEFADCHKIFMETSGRRDVVSWTGIITAFAERDPEEALFFFCRLRQEEDFSPDRYTFSIVIKACAGLATERHAMAVHSQIVKAGFEDDTWLANALIHSYARCGSIALSKQVFDEMMFRDTVSWNSMLKSYALHGKAKESLDLFGQMNLQPDSATFVALLSSCSHAGMLEEGTEIFNTMFENNGVVPQVDHFACMIDMLGRVGRIFEAEDLIRKMPMEPDSIIWSTLLAACRKHGETRVAKLAADKLKELDPENSLGYVQMSNLYCSGGSFSEAGLIRKEMEGCKVRKEPGLSWIEIGNRVHEFASGGRRHPQREAIFFKLEGIIRQLKEMGYVPETSLALHDIEEEHKEEQLYHHSEKLALVFAIMNLDSLHSEMSPIKIMKNIRICVDCHNFMKLASKLFHREIVVRDSNRFHHFKHRECSCNDFW